MFDYIHTQYILVLLVCTFIKENDWWRWGATSREEFLTVPENKIIVLLSWMNSNQKLNCEIKIFGGEHF